MTHCEQRSPSEPGNAGTALARPLVAIAGNPNTGKTTVFNRLTGADHKVGNYPGVTVERHTGTLALPSGDVVDIIDIPGAYSLSARSREEEIAIQAVSGFAPFETPDLVVIVVDATQLSRNLYLVLQILELELPVIVALNMLDMLAERGLSIDVAALTRELGVPVVEMSALRGRGIEELRGAIERVLADPSRARPGAKWKPESSALSEDVARVIGAVPASWSKGNAERARALALWALLSLDEQDELEGISKELRALVADRRGEAAKSGRQIDSEVIRGRYGWIDARMPEFVSSPKKPVRAISERVDGVLLNPVLGFPIFLVAMGVVFQSLFSWADPAIHVVEQIFAYLAELVRSVIPSGIFQEFLTNGMIAGVGSVLVFLPQILLLFFFIGLMEDSGYMARVAFLMDRVMKAIGLHGRAFVPMLSGYACAVPAIMATRTMERQRDRTLTMLVIPLMTCSARLPVYALIIGALFPPSRVFGALPVQGLLMIGMYLFSTLTALVAAAVLSRTLFKGPRVPLILELPPYRMPHWPSVLRMMWQRSRAFLKEAGGVILLCTIALWALLSFPRDAARREHFEEMRSQANASELSHDAREQRIGEIDSEEAGEKLRASYGGRLGHAIEPAIAPLGFDWKIGIGLIGAFAAREVFVSTMGVVYGESADPTARPEDDSPTLRERIRKESRADGAPVYTPLAGLSLMIFFALACQCMSTLATVYRETRSWRWPAFLFAYMTTLAWIASFAVYQGGRWLGLG
jgi:ferrous iron transport protein B